jgi:uncharacterized phiE125 gp8 family phage protein
VILQLITPPTTEPVTQTDVFNQIRQDADTFQDSTTLVDMLIIAVRERAESVTNRALLTQTWELTLDRFPNFSWNYGQEGGSHGNRIRIPKPPLVSINSIIYIDIDGNEQTLDPSLYKVVSKAEPAYVQPAYGTVWPATLNDSAVITINFTCGYIYNIPFNPTAIYTVGEVVDYNGTGYTCTALTTAGILPTVTAHWAVSNNVPKSIKQWMLLNIANLIENRESIGVAYRETKYDITESLADVLIENFRIYRL